MTAGLFLPFGQGVRSPFERSQGFDGHNRWEPKGILTSDAHGPLSSRMVLQASTAPGYYDHLHSASDYGCPNGTRLRALQSGVVLVEGSNARFGDGSIDGEIFILVQVHRDATIQSGYLMTHNARNLVHAGARVTKNQPVAISDSTGRGTGAHVHIQWVTGSPFLNLLSLMWGTRGTRWNIERLLEGHDQASRKFLIPNV